MTADTFLGLIGSDSSLSIQGLTEDKRIVVLHELTGAHYAIDPAALRDVDAGELHDVLTGKREPEVLIGITRIVGYYSQTRNWNASKLGELKARRRGRYEV